MKYFKYKYKYKNILNYLNIKNICNFNYNYERNFSYDQMIFLFKYIKEKPFRVVVLDEGVGIGVLKNIEMYAHLAVIIIILDLKNFSFTLMY